MLSEFLGTNITKNQKLSADATAAVISRRTSCTSRTAGNNWSACGSCRSSIGILPPALALATESWEARFLNTVGVNVTIIVLVGNITIQNILTVRTHPEGSRTAHADRVDALLIAVLSAVLINGTGIRLRGGWGGSWCRFSLTRQLAITDEATIA